MNNEVICVIFYLWKELNLNVSSSFIDQFFVHFFCQYLVALLQVFKLLELTAEVLEPWITNHAVEV